MALPTTGNRRGGRLLSPRAPLPFLFVIPPVLTAVRTLIQGDVARFGQAVGVAALFYLAAWLICRGVKAAESGQPFPGRALGSVALGLATAGASWFLAGNGLIVTILLGVGALVAATLRYGSELAPTRGEGLTADAADARQLVGEARAKLERLARARYRIQGAPELTQKLDSIKGWIEKILGMIEEDPRDLRRARKFLVVYLDGAGEVADKYVALQAKGEGASFAPRLLDLLTEMEKVSAEQHAKLLENDSFDLDVQLEVLSDRLKREGVA